MRGLLSPNPLVMLFFKAIVENDSSARWKDNGKKTRSDFLAGKETRQLYDLRRAENEMTAQAGMLRSIFCSQARLTLYIL